MTRATLLQVLARPTALGPAEVRELEQLAQAFPYCQTAHLLLAKAAHDHGTMLAGQRLRRAATYAADRTLLRRLIEEVEPAPVAPPVEDTWEKMDIALPTELQPTEALVPMALVAAPTPPTETFPVVEAPAEAAPEVPPLAPVAEVAPATPEPALVPEPAPVLTAPVPSPIQEITEPVAIALPPAQAPTEVSVIDVPAAAVTPAVETEPDAAPEAEAATDLVITTATQFEPETEGKPALALAATGANDAAVSPVLIDREGVDIPATSPALPGSIPLIPEAAPEDEPDLPAQAPAIRPPVEAGEARFEFGLSEPPPTPPTYELPGLVDEWAAAAVTLSLGGPEPAAGFPALGSGALPAPPVLTPAAFIGDATVGYGFGESSRLGFSMQLLDLLTDKAEKDAVLATAVPPAAPLPPAGAFFEPDQLLLDHWATHRPPAPVLPSSVDLINNFLKRQPRLTRPGMLPPAPGGQTDLSVRSTRAEPDLVSENLARIFVRQGKTARAIEIYEKLMVKQPEKMAYFAAQIQSLQPSA
ncbi:hypothetical protein Q5H92_25345 [Hymenobacter sp. M29]|uniref:Tetratricopeptide repeat protein n=1 Tax=Hymenobacter mellowenesis TaxID=3063995 RepID=A0ABT9AIM6_9BACT|nr:hypothetical protein [Hymenobacter sp. M29]MDO7849713.1 hypothetical protein [Hymenobacter sp. M29]